MWCFVRAAELTHAVSKQLDLCEPKARLYTWSAWLPGMQPRAEGNMTLNSVLEFCIRAWVQLTGNLSGLIRENVSPIHSVSCHGALLPGSTGTQSLPLCHLLFLGVTLIPRSKLALSQSTLQSRKCWETPGEGRLLPFKAKALKLNTSPCHILS